MNFFDNNKDENKKSDDLQPNYRFLPAPRPIRPYPPLPRLTLMPHPHPPLLAMQLMMLRIRNSAKFTNETQNSNLLSYFNSGTFDFVISLLYL